MPISARRVGDDVWEATDGASEPTMVRALLRPDGRRQLFVDDRSDRTDSRAALATLLGAVHADVPEDLVHQVAVTDTETIALLRSAGFLPVRTELTFVITIDRDRLRRLHRIAEGSGLDLIGAADADLPRLRALDEAVREDIPGSEGWIWAPEDFAWETFSSDFDPATYRVAVDPSSGEYLGLIRIWMKGDGPAFGCLGVRRERRGTRVAAVLVTDVLSALLDRGFRTVRAGVDDTNRASLGVVGRFEHEIVARTVELVRTGTVPA